MRRILRSSVISSTSTKESVFGSSAFGPRIADARRHLQRAELHRLVDIDVEGDDAAGDLVDAGELGDRIGDALWPARLSACERRQRRPVGGHWRSADAVSQCAAPMRRTASATTRDYARRAEVIVRNTAAEVAQALDTSPLIAGSRSTSG